MTRFKSIDNYQKGILLLMGAIVLIFTVIYAKTILSKGFDYRDDVFLVHNQKNGNTKYSGSKNGKDVCLTISADKVIELQYGDTFYGPYVVKDDPTAISKYNDSEYYEQLRGIEVYCGEEIIFRGGVCTIGERRFFLEEEEESKTPDMTEIDIMEPNLSDILDLLEGPELTHKGMWLFWLFGVIICLMTAILILYADELFHHSLAFRIRNADSAEPSDWELLSRKLSSTILLGTAFVSFIIGLQF